LNTWFWQDGKILIELFNRLWVTIHPDKEPKDNRLLDQEVTKRGIIDVQNGRCYIIIKYMAPLVSALTRQYKLIRITGTYLDVENAAPLHAFLEVAVAPILSPSTVAQANY
jgi:hypothetical protein